MRSRIGVAVLLALLVGASVGSAQWKMRVHQPGVNTDYTVSEIDSVTFYYDEAPGMVLIPAGTFAMGDGSASCGATSIQVTLTNDFYLDQHEVTNQDYIDAVQWAYDNGHVTADLNWVYDNLDGSSEGLLHLYSDDCEIAFTDSVFTLVDTIYGDHPVKVVTWFGAVGYCDWLSMQAGLERAYQHTGDWACNGGDPYAAQGSRLPTDAEWEYAAQYDDERTYPWGNEEPTCTLVNCYSCVWWTAPVDSFPSGASSLGLLNMAGNVSEWCDDWFYCDLSGVYTEPVTDPVYPFSSSHRVARGGSWTDQVAALPCAARNAHAPGGSYNYVGFRTARTVSP